MALDMGGPAFLFSLFGDPPGAIRAGGIDAAAPASKDRAGLLAPQVLHNGNIDDESPALPRALSVSVKGFKQREGKGRGNGDLALAPCAATAIRGTLDEIGGGVFGNRRAGRVFLFGGGYYCHCGSP